MSCLLKIPEELTLWDHLLFQPSKLVISGIKIDPEGRDYKALDFTLNEKRVKFRVGKLTPTKQGFFITFWKRIGKGPIQPYAVTDPFDLLMVSVQKELFVFPKDALLQKGLLSCEGKAGKRAMRIYLPWENLDSSQAKKTQKWQSEYLDYGMEKGMKWRSS